MYRAKGKTVSACLGRKVSVCKVQHMPRPQNSCTQPPSASRLANDEVVVVVVVKANAKTETEAEAVAALLTMKIKLKNYSSHSPVSS